jgi:hypothetical protein
MGAYISDGTLMTALDALEQLLRDNQSDLKGIETEDDREFFYRDYIAPIEAAIKECHGGLTGEGQ